MANIVRLKEICVSDLPQNQAILNNLKEARKKEIYQQLYNTAIDSWSKERKLFFKLKEKTNKNWSLLENYYKNIPEYAPTGSFWFSTSAVWSELKDFGSSYIQFFGESNENNLKEVINILNQPWLWKGFFSEASVILSKNNIFLNEAYTGNKRFSQIFPSVSLNEEEIETLIKELKDKEKKESSISKIDSKTFQDMKEYINDFIYGTKTQLNKNRNKNFTINRNQDSNVEIFIRTIFSEKTRDRTKIADNFINQLLNHLKEQKNQGKDVKITMKITKEERGEKKEVSSSFFLSKDETKILNKEGTEAKYKLKQHVINLGNNVEFKKTERVKNVLTEMVNKREISKEVVDFVNKCTSKSIIENGYREYINKNKEYTEVFINQLFIALEDNKVKINEDLKDKLIEAFKEVFRQHLENYFTGYAMESVRKKQIQIIENKYLKASKDYYNYKKEWKENDEIYYNILYRTKQFYFELLNILKEERCPKTWDTYINSFLSTDNKMKGEFLELFFVAIGKRSGLNIKQMGSSKYENGPGKGEQIFLDNLIKIDNVEIGVQAKAVQSEKGSVSHTFYSDNIDLFSNALYRYIDANLVSQLRFFSLNRDFTYLNETIKALTLSLNNYYEQLSRISSDYLAEGINRGTKVNFYFYNYYLVPVSYSILRMIYFLKIEEYDIGRIKDDKYFYLSVTEEQQEREANELLTDNLLNSSFNVYQFTKKLQGDKKGNIIKAKDDIEGNLLQDLILRPIGINILDFTKIN